MNVKRILTITLAALFVCLAFAGAVSAFTVTQDAVTTPSGSLVPGEDVKSQMKIVYYTDTIDVGGSLTLKTDLVGQSWVVNVSKGGTVVTTLHPSYATGYSISGFDLSGYSTDIELEIFVDGKVSSSSAGSSISAIMLVESGTSGSSGTKSYASPAQKVYDTGLLAGSLQTLIDGINSVESGINECVAAGYDCSAAKSSLETARSKYQAALSAGTENGVAAFGYFEEGSTALTSAKQSLAYSLLSIILSYTSQIDNNITQLYGNGWNTEAYSVYTQNEDLKSRYDSCLQVYQAGNPNIADLVTLRNDAAALNTVAGDYLIQSQNPFGSVSETLGKIWPFIVIGVVVIVVGIIVVIIIRKRKNNWDELG